METIQGYDNWKLASPPERPEGKCDSCFFFGKYDCKEADNFDYEGCDYYSESKPELKDYPDWFEDDEIEDEEEAEKVDTEQALKNCYGAIVTLRLALNRHQKQLKSYDDKRDYVSATGYSTGCLRGIKENVEIIEKYCKEVLKY